MLLHLTTNAPLSSSDGRFPLRHADSDIARFFIVGRSYLCSLSGGAQ